MSAIDENEPVTVASYGHGSIKLTAYPSSSRIRVEASADNSVMDWSDLFEFVDRIRKPRTITTAEELDAAIYAAFEDGGHLIVSDRRGRPWIIWGDEDDDAWVESWPQEDDPERLTLSDINLPATVLHEGEAKP